MFSSLLSRIRGGSTSSSSTNASEQQKQQQHHQSSSDSSLQSPLSSEGSQKSMSSSQPSSKQSSNSSFLLQEQESAAATSSSVASPNFFAETEPSGVIYSKKDWLDVLRNRTRENTSYTEIKASLRAGIPKSLRARIWMWLANVKAIRGAFASGIYKRLAESVNPRWELELRKDINRTMVESPFFQGPTSIGQISLFRVLNAFCNIDTSGVGYAQGSNMIVAVILLTLHDPVNFKNPKVSFGKENVTHGNLEEWAFWIFFYVMTEKNHHKIYQENMVKRFQLLDSLKQKIEQQSPQVMQILDDAGIEFGLAFDQEFFSILSYKCPLPLSQLAIGMFLLDGHPALIDIMARIILINQSKLLASSQELESIIYFLKTDKNRITWETYANTPHLLVPFASAHQYIEQENQ